jgi:hypothetical protein
MADNNIVYKIIVDSESGTATIRDLKGQIVATQVPVNKLKENFNDLTVSINKNKNATDGNVVAHKNSEITLNAEISKLNSLRSALDISSKEYVEMGNTIDLLNQKKDSLRRSTEGLVNSNGMLKNSSGAATSATMELGRVISDAPYGIRGMANNITQLVSQLGFATTAAGSFKAAMRQMWTALMGPLGIVLAITTVVSLFDGFFGAQKKVEKSTSDLKSEFEGLARVLRDDVGASIEGYIELMKEKAIIDAEIADSSKRVSDIEEELIKISKDRTYWEGIKATQIELTGEVQERTLRRLNPLIDREKELIEERNSIYKDSADKINEFKQKRDEQNKSSIKTVKGLKQEISLLQKQRDKLSESSEQWQKYTLKITNAEEAIKKIKGELNKNVKEPLVFGSVDWYNDAISSLEKFRDANLKVGSKAFKDETKIIERLKKELEESITPKVKPKSFVDSYYNEIAGLAEIIKDEDFDGISDTAKITGKLILPFKPTFVPPEEDFYAELDRFIERYQTIMTGLTSFVDGEFERQLTIEQNKTNILNEELNNRLLNESLSADQRKAIQNEIAQNDERLRVRQEAIKKKAFNAQKAFNISAALVETYAAASSAYRNTLAQPANILDPTVGLVRAKKNAAIAMAGGLLQVAAIARQKYQSSSAATPINVGDGGASGGTSERADPSFNIVGRSGENLLINAIQAQFGKPLKAYVVSRDVTTQQQLDGMIVGQAGT